MARIKGNGDPLTHQQMDQNFTELNEARTNITTLQSNMSDRTSRLENLENRVWGYRLIDVYNNVYKNLPNHTNNESHSRIKAMSFFLNTCNVVGVSDSRLDTWLTYIEQENTNQLLQEMSSEPATTQLQLIWTFLALGNSRVQQLNKYYNRNYPSISYESLINGTWNPGSQWETDIQTMQNNLNNSEASDAVIYNYARNNTQSPFEWDTKITGWSPV